MGFTGRLRECGAHIEIVSGPALLSKWVGESESALRGIFERARELAPSVVLFDELDALAPRRDGSSAQHEVSVVAQLLVLLDGLEGRGQVFVLGTTNRPDDIDPALRRPGRFDQVVWMEAPDELGRTALFQHYMRGLTLAHGVDCSELAARLASSAAGFSGADIAFVCRRAALLCVKEATCSPREPDSVTVSEAHFHTALVQVALGLETSGHLRASIEDQPRQRVGGLGSVGGCRGVLRDSTADQTKPPPSELEREESAGDIEGSSQVPSNA